MAWVAIEDVIRHLPDKYSDAHLAYKQRIFGQTYEDSERWDFCYEAAKEAFPFPIGLMFVEENLNPGAKERVGCKAKKSLVQDVWSLQHFDP